MTRSPVSLLALLFAFGCGGTPAPGVSRSADPGSGPAADAVSPPPPTAASTVATGAGTQPPAAGPPTAGSPPSAPQPPAGSAPSRSEERTFDAASLGVKKAYRVWLPRGYDDSTRRFPVVVMLHGLGGNERNWLENGELARTADAMALPAIVVMPDGDASFYVDRASQPPFETCMTQKPAFNPGEPPATFCVKTPRYEAYITQDLLRDVDATYRTLAKREARGIGGLSMGGFGALQLGMRHGDKFAAVAAHSAPASLLYDGPRPFDAAKVQLASSPEAWGKRYPAAVRDHIRAVLGPSVATWQSHDPATLAASLPPGRLALYLDCGTEDDFGFADNTRHLHQVLEGRGIAHTFELAPGRHDFTYWKARLPKSLTFFASVLARQ